jgi:hypothetical protein
VRPIFVVQVRAEPGVDAVRALRGWLKRGLRDFGLKCVGITPREMEDKMADMREYGTKFIKVDHVRDGPIQTRIVNVVVGEQFGRPILELETGSQFTLNETNTNTLIKAWGSDSDDWIGKEIELFVGSYHDWRSDTDKETVKVRAISEAKTAQNGGELAASKPLPPSRTTAAKLQDDLSDDIPY